MLAEAKACGRGIMQQARRKEIVAHLGAVKYIAEISATKNRLLKPKFRE